MADIAKAKWQIDAILRREEGERLEPYLCQAGRPTIGVGATTYPDGRKVTMADPPITREQMDSMLSQEIDKYIAAVLVMVGDAPTTTNQLVAFVICAYNIGIEGLRGSTMMRAHRAGDAAAAARAFGLWNKYRPGGPGTAAIEHPALTARRAREAALYLTPDHPSTQAGPQAIEAESSLVRSPIQQSGAVTVATGAVAVAASMFESVKPLLKDATEAAAAFGVSPGVVLGVVLLVAGGTTLYWRYRQRAQGWA